MRNGGEFTLRMKIELVVIMLFLVVGVYYVSIFFLGLFRAEPICPECSLGDVGYRVLQNFEIYDRCPLAVFEVKCNTPFFEQIDKLIEEKPSQATFAEDLKRNVVDPDTFVVYFPIGERIGHIQVFKYDLSMPIPDGMCKSIPNYERLNTE